MVYEMCLDLNNLKEQEFIKKTQDDESFGKVK